ncbi:MAG: sulfatase-like hydrolase/transferase, partial [Verrucomicrobiota bacterium]|nr:sulfatase-like hydrolase/transferase [Verrucomicrobiota bacterium]
MNSRFFTNIIVMGLCVTGISGMATGRGITPPNVVIIFMDDMGWKDLGCYGSTFYETPNIDRLCSEGMKFTDAYSACNVCSPTRHALVTGKYPTRTHFTNVLNRKPKGGRKLSGPVQDDILNNAETTFAELFQQAGYRTGFFGKWHMNFEKPFSFKNGAHGFDVWDGVHSEGGWMP